MNFDLTDEQRMLQQAAKEMLAARYTSEKVRALGESETGLDEEIWRETADLNWPGLIVSEEHGGQELGTVELVVLMEQLGYALAPGPFLSNTLAALVLEAAGTSDQRERYLAPLATGDKRGTLALWDRGAGRTPDDVALEPERSADGWTLTGEKLFVLDAGIADFLVVGATEGRLYVVDRDAPGVSIEQTPTIDSTRKQYAVKLAGVRVDEDAALESDSEALGLARDRAFVALAAELVGVAQRAMEMAVQYAKERKQFGRPIGAYQAVSHPCAQMLLETEGARSAAFYGGWAADNEPETAPLAASVAKAYSSDAAWRVTASSLQVHGGIGFTWEHDLHLYLKRARCGASFLGDSRWHRERVTRLVLERQAAPRARRGEAAAPIAAG
jgi:alkylation response protein AidB-like acyl-CoA dehydrogenase